MKQRAVKMPDDLWASVQAEAAKLGLTASEFVRLAVEQKIGVEPLEVVSEVHRWSADQVATAHKAQEQITKHLRASNAKVIEATTAVPEPRTQFKCPIHGCTFRAPSAAARCGAHGRLVVPV